jgi:hypothetical protein
MIVRAMLAVGPPERIVAVKVTRRVLRTVSSRRPKEAMWTRMRAFCPARTSYWRRRRSTAASAARDHGAGAPGGWSCERHRERDRAPAAVADARRAAHLDEGVAAAGDGHELVEMKTGVASAVGGSRGAGCEPEGDVGVGDGVPCGGA